MDNNEKITNKKEWITSVWTHIETIGELKEYLTYADNKMSIGNKEVRIVTNLKTNEELFQIRTEEKY